MARRVWDGPPFIFLTKVHTASASARSDDGKKHLSKRAFMHLDSDVEAQVSKKEALDGIHDQQALHTAIVAAGRASRNHELCTPALAERVRKLMCLEPGSLRGMQANYQHDDSHCTWMTPTATGSGAT